VNYKRLETFVWVASLGNFRKAAERLHTTQPAISARIAGLEEELGVKLFEREGGSSPITLTSKGKELLPYVEKILYQTEQLRKRAGLSKAYSGVLRLVLSETILDTWLPDFLSRLHKDMPNLDVEMTVDISANLTTSIKDRTLGLGFLMGALSDPNLFNRVFMHLFTVVGCKPQTGFAGSTFVPRRARKVASYYLCTGNQTLC